MKLVELLAREWSEWPSNCDYAVCDSDGEIRAIGTGTHNDFYPATAVDLEDRLNGTALLVPDDGKRVTRSDWSAERARIAKPAKKAGKDGWIRHRGGKCPVDAGVMVDVRHRYGDVFYGEAALEGFAETWSHSQTCADIMAYRLHKPADNEESEARPIESPTLECQAAGRSDRINPLQWRDRSNEIDATTQALATERAELVQKLASEGFALIGRINDLLTDAAQKHEDMGDWRNWKVGDLVEIECEKHGHCFQSGDIVKIDSIGDDNSDEDCRFKCYALDGSDFWFVGESECKFHSRPSA